MRRAERRRRRQGRSWGRRTRGRAQQETQHARDQDRGQRTARNQSLRRSLGGNPRHNSPERWNRPDRHYGRTQTETQYSSQQMVWGKRVRGKDGGHVEDERDRASTGEEAGHQVRRGRERHRTDATIARRKQSSAEPPARSSPHVLSFLSRWRVANRPHSSIQDSISLIIMS